ncbi:succinylglutamate desuccinylase/aspartoacylase family protein [Ekhidna sp.]|uniref:succinylglutamate desuccinylase/aspartoacylase family protein n=1 Tax=Ekhidna sp. TaxID=2608089 RepID=UPI003CCBFD18
MTQIRLHSPALNSEIKISRIIGSYHGDAAGPTLIFMGGIHGNEPAGVFALHRVINHLEQNKIPINGNIFCIAGNLQALKQGTRFLAEDMNRIWTKGRIDLLPEAPEEAENEEIAEQIEVYNLIREILKTHPGPFYFFDIHTTSSETLPFLTVNDSLLNRGFTSQYPLPIILGIEEYLSGPILSYINELGYVAFGFEAGQHDDLGSIENAEAFSYLSLVFTGLLDRALIDYHHYYDLLAKTAGDVKSIFEIYFRYRITPEEEFVMEPGFFNFQRVRRDQLVAKSNGKDIRAKTNGRIFLPLYQNQGTDGFFAIRRIKRLFLNLSTKMRKYQLDRVLVWLPGISWLDDKKSALVINRTIARFLAKQLLHLLGYRSIEKGKDYLLAYNRESEARNQDYQKANWFEHIYDSI